MLRPCSLLVLGFPMADSLNLQGILTSFGNLSTLQGILLMRLEESPALEIRFSQSTVTGSFPQRSLLQTLLRTKACLGYSVELLFVHQLSYVLCHSLFYLLVIIHSICVLVPSKSLSPPSGNLSLTRSSMMWAMQCMLQCL